MIGTPKYTPAQITSGYIDVVDENLKLDIQSSSCENLVFYMVDLSAFDNGSIYIFTKSNII